MGDRYAIPIRFGASALRYWSVWEPRYDSGENPIQLGANPLRGLRVP